MEKRKVLDCRERPSENGCTVTISGKENEVLLLAVYHAVTSHGHIDTPELREQIKAMLEDE
jgi:uncharacterized protein DUF1059